MARSSSWALGLGLGFVMLALALLSDCSGAAAIQGHKYFGESPDFYNVSKASVPDVFKKNAGQVASKVTKALNTAAMKFPRRDAMKKFQKYHGGFDVANTHYWASVAFVGIWGYALAIICLIFAIMICSCKFCCYVCGYTLPKKDEQNLSPLRRLSRLSSLSFFILCTIAGTAVLFWGTAKTGKQLKKTTDIIINATDFALDTSSTVVNSLNAAADIITDPTASSNIRSAADNVGGSTGGIAAKVKKIKSKVPLIIKLVVIFLNIIGAFILFFAVVGLVGMCMGMSTLGTVAFTGMGILLVAAWLLGGIDFTLSNVANDACQAMDDFNTDPTTSKLASIFPCKTQAQADSTAASAKSAIKDIVAQTNTAITNINTAASSSMPLICDPYGAGPTYAAAACAPGTKLMANFETDYAGYRCGNDNAGPCAAANTPITNSAFLNLATAMNAGAAIANLIPSVADIMTCSFIHNAFGILTASRCVKLIDGLNISWFGFALTAAFMMPLQLFWIFI